MISAENVSNISQKTWEKEWQEGKMYLATYNQGFLLFSNIRYWEENLEEIDLLHIEATV